MHVAREPVELGDGDRARLSVAAGASQGGGQLRAAVERVGALVRLDLRELRGDLEALGLGEADDGGAVRGTIAGDRPRPVRRTGPRTCRRSRMPNSHKR
jgi:hypothetical protein